MPKRKWQFIGLASGERLSEELVGTSQDVQLYDPQQQHPVTLWLNIVSLERNDATHELTLRGTMRYGPDCLAVECRAHHGLAGATLVEA